MSYRPASLCSLATQFQTQFLELIPRPIAGLKFSTLAAICRRLCNLSITPRLMLSVLSGKYRGRPPKFEASEVDGEGRVWYACSVCSLKFEVRSELMQHMRTHNRERPFHCKICGLNFKQVPVSDATVHASPSPPQYGPHQVVDQITIIKTPNPKCRLCWCLIEFINCRYWYFRPAL